MALIKCPECGKEISDKAASCPNCGFPIAQGSTTQEPPQKQKEYDIEMLDSMRIKASKANIEVYYKGNLLLEANPMDFVLNYDKEEPDDLGRVQLKVAFSIPKYAKPFKICLSTGSSAYEQAKEFTTEIVERYFKKQYVVEWYMLDKSVMDNCDMGEANKTRTTIENIEKPKTYSAPEPQYTTQPTATKKKKKGGCGTILWVILGLALLGGWMEHTDKKKDDTAQSQTEIHNDGFKTTAKKVEKPTEAPAPTPTNEITVGSTFERDGLQITVNNADTNFQNYEDEYGYYTPSSGMKYVMASFTFTNTSKTDKYVSIYDFDCYADNQTCEQKYGLDNSDFINTNLSAGRTVSFNTYYEVPINANSIELEYTLNLWTDKKMKIILQ